jgi:hypothetical protein
MCIFCAYETDKQLSLLTRTHMKGECFLYSLVCNTFVTFARQRSHNVL